MTRPRKIFTSVAIYMVLAAVQRGISFLILPFITHAMSPADYGAASILAAGSIFLTALLANPLSNLIARVAARDQADGPALLRTIGVYCYVILPLAAASAAVPIVLLAPQILGIPGYIWAIELMAAGFQPSFSTFAQWVAQAREDPNRFALITSTSVLTAVLSKLIFVIVLQMGVLGWALSDLLSAIVTAVVAMTLVRLPQAKFGRREIRYILNFSLPLVPHNVSLWALMFLSRPVMALVASHEQVGLLSFAINLAQLSGLVLTEFNRGVLVHYAREEFPAPTNETVRIVKWQLFAALAAPTLVGCGVAIGGPLVFAESYWPAFGVAGILLGAQVAIGLYPIPMNYLTQAAGITRYSSIASGAGAAVLIGGILLLGRAHGAVGVAFATTAGYFTMAGVAQILVLANRLNIAWRSWLPAWPAIGQAAVGLALAVLATRLPVGDNATTRFVIASLGLTAAAAALLKKIRITGVRNEHGDRF